jgi:SAM-dependent methyltransferase
MDGGERETQSGDAPSQWAYGSQAYAASTSQAETAFASTWLEQQALHPFIRETGQRALRALALPPGASVLEVGCGTGVFLPALAEAVGPEGRLVGIDHSQAFLDEAGARLARLGLTTRVELIRGDAHELPFEDAAFDAVHCERVLMHLEDPDRAIREMVRVAKPGAVVVAAEIYAQGAETNHPDHALERRLGAILSSGMRNGWMGLELRHRFGRAGLTDTRAEAVIDVEDVLDPDEGVELRNVAEQLPVAAERARAIALADDLVDMSARGMHCAYALMFIVRGTVPGGIATP